MPKHKPVYTASRREAERLGEMNEWVESFAENCTCARAIDEAIAEGYGDTRPNKDCAKEILEE